ncbi:hypothetical protein EWM60_08510 [Candidatus Erwinia dacicola]|uniref:Uncharacterized protein n=1 Tax=Candidatus Erwinia dacicola TaxID=252393 RepID=A0A328TK39_9GAMM|nr:hypothetical protein [Candidatus Erwinia dacicola]RAP70450.1 hypothetical protein ACZ87_02745 [Candidatus Erwinia dacicola]
MPLEEALRLSRYSALDLQRGGQSHAHTHSKRNKVTHWPAPDKITVLALLESLLHAGKTSDSERT